MPRGKELEQLPMSQIAAGVGDDHTRMNRETLQGITVEQQVAPANVAKEKKKRG
jgi:hypothetical protein